MSSSNDQPAATETKIVEEKPAAASESNNPETESKPDTEMAAAPVKADEAPKEAEKPAADADAATESPAEPAAAAAAETEKKEEPAAAATEDAMDSSSDTKDKKAKRKASEIEEEAPKENGEAAAEKPAEKTDEVATKKAKTLNGAATPTKVVPGDEAAKAATDAMPQQAPVA